MIYLIFIEACDKGHERVLRISLPLLYQLTTIAYNSSDSDS